MKKDAHLGKKVFGIPFNRYVRHTAGLNEETLKQNKWIQYGHLFNVWEMFRREKSSISKGLSQNILISKKNDMRLFKTHRNC